MPIKKKNNENNIYIPINKSLYSISFKSINKYCYYYCIVVKQLNLITKLIFKRFQ